MGRDPPRGHGHDDAGRLTAGNGAWRLAPRDEDGLVASEHGPRTRDPAGRFRPVRPKPQHDAAGEIDAGQGPEVAEADLMLAESPQEARRLLIEEAAADGSLRRVWRSMLRLAERGSIPAAKLVCETAWGKPMQAVEADVRVKVEPVLTLEERAEIERVLAACYPAGEVRLLEAAPCGPCEAGPETAGVGGEAPDAESLQR